MTDLLKFPIHPFLATVRFCPDNSVCFNNLFRSGVSIDANSICFMKNVSSSTSTDEERTRLPKLSFKDIELRKRRDPVSLLPAAKVGVEVFKNFCSGLLGPNAKEDDELGVARVLRAERVAQSDIEGQESKAAEPLQNRATRRRSNEGADGAQSCSSAERKDQ